MKKGLLFAATFLISFPAYADTLGLHAGIGNWFQNYSGTAQYDGDELSIEDTFGLDNDNGLTFYVALEHFVPLVPNIKIAHSKIESSGDNTLSENTEFAGITFPAGTQVSSSVKLDHTDLVLYYEILDNVVSADIGLNIRVIQGEFSLGSTTNTASTPSFTAPLPMLYGALKFDLPFTGFYARGEGNIIAYSGNKILDLKVAAGYESSVGLGCEIGWRNLALEIKDVDDVDADVKFNGAYAMLTIHL